MKRTMVRVFAIFALLISSFNGAAVNAAVDTGSINLQWNTHGTDSPMDDTLTFTAPSKYRDMQSTSYKYWLSSHSQSSSTPDRIQLDDNDLSIDSSTGAAVVNLKSYPDFGKGFDLTYYLTLYEGNTLQMETSVSHSYPSTDLGEINSFWFNKDELWTNFLFGAERYEFDVYNSEGVRTQNYSTNDRYQKLTDTDCQVGNVIKVTGFNDTYNKKTATAVYSIVAINDVKWIENVSSDASDDTLTFTAPAGYRSLSAVNYSYGLVSYDANGEQIEEMNIDTENASINSSTGLVTVKLDKIQMYGQGFQLHYGVILYNNFGGTDKLHYAVSTIADINAEVPSSLPAPKSISVYGQHIIINHVFGATKYVLTILDANNKTLKEYTDADGELIIDSACLKDGYTLKAVAYNDAYHLSSQAVTKIITGSQTIVDISKIRVTGADLTTTVGGRPSFTGKLWIGGDTVDTSIRNAFKMVEYWMEVDNTGTPVKINCSGVIYSGLSLPTETFTTFEQGHQYEYGFAVYYKNPSGIYINTMNANLEFSINGNVTSRDNNAYYNASTGEGVNSVGVSSPIARQMAGESPTPPAPTVETQQMYRLYNGNSGEHFYTASAGERDHLISLGWGYEGVGWTAPVKSNTPVYRLYNGNGGEHHYTTNLAEKNNLVNLGWSYEGIGWYSDDNKTVPLYRQYNPNAFANNHNYTTRLAENNWLVSLGWRAEGIGWYGAN